MSVTMPHSTNFEIPMAKSDLTFGEVSSFNLATSRFVIV